MFNVYGSAEKPTFSFSGGQAAPQGAHHSRTLSHHSRTENNSQDMFFLGGSVIFIRYNGTSF
jgi:hypothetical protein